MLASFKEWNPREYLADYNSRVEQDEKYTLKFLVQQFKKIEEMPTALEFGIGPTVHHLFALSPYVNEIHVSDLLPSNLKEVHDWQRAKIGAHDWRPFVEKVLNYEGVSAPTTQDISKREAMTRARITQYFMSDASFSHPLGPNGNGTYSILLSCYCIDSATSDKATWLRYMRNMLRLLKPNGFFVTAALRNCSYYRVGERYFPSANINEDDFEELFTKLDFDLNRTVIQVEQVPEHQEMGYGSIVLASSYLRHALP